MKNIYRNIETYFERLTAIVTTILGNSITFILALVLVIFWLGNKEFYNQERQECIRDIMHAVIFLTLFIIQKSFNRFSASIHLKLNELVVSHETANNAVITIEEKTEHEMTALSKEYAELSKEIAEIAEEVKTQEVETNGEEKPRKQKVEEENTTLVK